MQRIGKGWMHGSETIMTIAGVNVTGMHMKITIANPQTAHTPMLYRALDP
jgi:hypothetical protein